MSQLDDANAAIAKIDAATTKSAASVDTMATITQQISDEVKALVAAGGVPQTVVDALNGIATKAQAVSDGLDSHSAFLQAIATQGATNPVPVPVPPPVTPTP